MRDFTRSEEVYRQALLLAQTGPGENHASYGATLHNLIGMYQAAGNLAAAEPLVHQELDILRRAVGDAHPFVAAVLNTQAEMRRAQGRFDEAEPLYRQAIDILQQAPPEQRSLSTAFNNLALLYLAKGDAAEAHTAVRQALDAERQTVGEDHPDHALTLHVLAQACAMAGKSEEALYWLDKATAADERLLTQVVALSFESQRLPFLYTLQENYHRYLALVLTHRSGDPEAVRSALELVLRRKTVSTWALAVARTTALERAYPDQREALADLALLERQIARKVLGGAGPEGLQAHQNFIADWQQQQQQLKAALEEKIPELARPAFSDAEASSVAEALPAGSALVEFVWVPVFDFNAAVGRGETQWQAPHYLAFVLPSGQAHQSRMIDLGEAEPLDRFLADYRAALLSGRSAECRAVGQALRAAVFDKLLPALGGRKRVLLAPGGEFTQLPFETLPAEDGRHLIDEWEISYLTSGRDLLAYRSGTRRPPQPPLVLGDADFDLDDTAPKVPVAPAADGFLGRVLAWLKSIGKKKPAPAAPAAPAEAGQGAVFEPVPQTLAEVRAVAGMLNTSPVVGVEVRKGRLRAAASPRVLHLATPSFFLADTAADSTQVRSVHPLRRSGLVLAGANALRRGKRPPPDAEDGLLTAEDVTGLDLFATSFTVLSLTDSTLNVERATAGVGALQRAFVQAGARALVMSLWRVPDPPRRQLVEDFYGRLLAGARGPVALRQAQLALKANQPDPRIWGGFVYLGDPVADLSPG